jgi:hypothetical protein
MTYLSSALYVSAAVLFALPIFGCSLITCEPHDGVVSISAIIQIKPLATIYAFWGAVFLTTLTHYQVQSRKGLNVLFAVLGSKFLIRDRAQVLALVEVYYVLSKHGRIAQRFAQDIVVLVVDGAAQGV